MEDVLGKKKKNAHAKGPRHGEVWCIWSMEWKYGVRITEAGGFGDLTNSLPT